jgi:hypothetical protein
MFNYSGSPTVMTCILYNNIGSVVFDLPSLYLTPTHQILTLEVLQSMWAGQYFIPCRGKSEM